MGSMKNTEKSELIAESTLRDCHISKHVLQASTASSHGLASVSLNFQSSNAYGGVVSDPIEGAPGNLDPLDFRKDFLDQCISCNLVIIFFCHLPNSIMYTKTAFQFQLVLLFPQIFT